MQKFRYIFIFIFLSGMLFTIISYLPILEEETPGHRVEMTKKDCKDDTSGDDDNNDDDPENEKTDLFFGHNFQSFRNIKDEHYFFIKHKTYQYSIGKINTPPPQI